MVESVSRISSIPFKGKPAAGAPDFLDALKQTFAKETGKLVGTKLPGDNGVIFSPNPQNLLSFNSADISEFA
ncbi:MAG: hypothetical protein WCW67_02480 [Candidatus Margulisiibacteriota bacterium]|jgi:hypothetical protein